MAVRKRRAGAEADRDVPDNVMEAPFVPRRTTVSDVLRERRIECGLEVDHVAQVLRIRPAVLTAIEAGQFDQMPGPAYAVGFVRSYATYLGLDAEALVLRFKAEAAEVARRPSLHFPLPLSDGRVPTRPLLIIGLLLAAIIYGGWYFLSTPSHDLADMVPAVPERLKHLISPEQVKQEAANTQAATPAPSAAPAAPATQAPSAILPKAPSPAAPVTTAANPAVSPSTGTSSSSPTAAPPAATTASPAQSPPPATEADGVPPVEDHPSATPQVAAVPATPDLAQPTVSDTGKPATQTSFGAPEGQSRIVLRATADAWIQVRDNQDNLLITRILKPGDSYNVPNQPGLSLVTGNAGGLDIVIDGNTLPKLGESGRVVRNLALDADRLLARKSRAN